MKILCFKMHCSQFYSGILKSNVAMFLINELQSPVPMSYSPHLSCGLKSTSPVRYKLWAGFVGSTIRGALRGTNVGYCFTA